MSYEITYFISYSFYRNLYIFIEESTLPHAKVMLSIVQIVLTE